MNRNLKPIILIVIAIGVYFTYTRAQLDEVETIQKTNDEYQKAIDNFTELVKRRDEIIAQYNQLNAVDRERLEKMLPDHVDNVKLIIDVNSVAGRHGLAIRDVETDAESGNEDLNEELGGIEVVDTEVGYNTVSLTFSVKSNYENFVNFLSDLEASLRIMDVRSIALETPTDNGSVYDYKVTIDTYWLREI